MNIYQKKIVKEKEYIFIDDCIPTKSIFLNSKPNNDSAIKPNINIRKFYGINSNQNQNQKKEKNNRQHRSKSLILTNKEMIEKYIPKEIKTVLIKFKKPLDQNNDIESLNHKTYYTNKFHKNKEKSINNLNNDFKTLEYGSSLNNNPNIINIDMSIENNNYKTNLYSYYIPFQENNKLNKHTRNKSALLKNEYIKFDNNSMNNSFNTIYKKSYCLDKHKNFGGNFKNKERSKTNSKIKIKIDKNNNCFKKNKKIMIKNISAPNIHKISSISDILSTHCQNNLNKNKIFFENINSNNYHNINTNRNISIILNNNANDMNNKIKKNYIKNNLSNNNENILMNTNANNIQNNKNKKCNLEIEFFKNDDNSSYIKNKLKIKNIPPLNFQNNIQNSSNTNIIDIGIDTRDMQHRSLYNKRNYNRNNSRQIFSNKNKNSNTITFEESMNDIYSMRNNVKNRGNLINLIDISEQDTKRDNQQYNKRKIEIDKESNYENKIGKNKSKIKIKKSNIKKVNKKPKNKIKGKIFRTNSTQKIETENNPYNINNIYKINQIKSIPLKLKYLNNMEIYSKENNNKYINNFTKKIKNLQNINDINTNLLIINEKDFTIWKDLMENFNKYKKRNFFKYN